MACPPLYEREVCNEDDCPVDCRLGDWGGWSSCSADCGGGVKQRARPVLKDSANGGNACEQSSDTQSCDIESCDVPCVLSDWSEWSLCSKACGGGTQSRTKSILTPESGTGECWEEHASARLNHKPCDHQPCADVLVGTDRTLLTCNSEVDVVIVLDGSASLGDSGWLRARSAAVKLVQSFTGVGTNTKLAVLLYGGPTTMDAYRKCVSSSGTGVDLKVDCGMEWVSHFNDDQTLVEDKVANLAFPRSTTMTSLALSQSESELFNGREDASSVVILITDGWPMSRTNTNSAAVRLQQVAKVLYVPVGYSAPVSLIEDMASDPKEDHIIEAPSLYSLDQPWILNKIIGSTCLVVS